MNTTTLRTKLTSMALLTMLAGASLLLNVDAVQAAAPAPGNRCTNAESPPVLTAKVRVAEIRAALSTAPNESGAIKARALEDASVDMAEAGQEVYAAQSSPAGESEAAVGNEAASLIANAHAPKTQAAVANDNAGYLAGASATEESEAAVEKQAAGLNAYGRAEKAQVAAGTEVAAKSAATAPITAAMAANAIEKA